MWRHLANTLLSFSCCTTARNFSVRTHCSSSLRRAIAHRGRPNRIFDCCTSVKPSTGFISANNARKIHQYVCDRYAFLLPLLTRRVNLLPTRVHSIPKVFNRRGGLQIDSTRRRRKTSRGKVCEGSISSAK